MPLVPLLPGDVTEKWCSDQRTESILRVNVRVDHVCTVAYARPQHNRASIRRRGSWWCIESLSRKMTMSNNDDYLVAVHEAGHAVVAVMSGIAVKAVLLHRGSKQGECGPERGRCELFDASAERDADASQFLKYILAGAAAEKRATGKYSERDGYDVDHAVTLARAMLDDWTPDSQRVRAVVQAAQTVTNVCMLDDTIWRWVNRVAKALVTFRRLSGRQVYELRPREARR